MLPWYMRKAAAALFADPPTAKIEDALEMFLKVITNFLYERILTCVLAFSCIPKNSLKKKNKMKNQVFITYLLLFHAIFVLLASGSHPEQFSSFDLFSRRIFKHV